MVTNVLITGAGSGFGRGIAFGLAKDSNYEVIATTQDYAQIFPLEQEAKRLGLKNIEFDKLDVTSPDDRSKAADWDIDVLLNNAGISEGGSVLDIPAKAIDAQLQTNVIGPIALTQIIARKMIERKSGRIVFMSSVAGLTVDPFSGAYSASKHAVEAFAEALYKETRPYDVDVLTINPGPFLTGFNDRMFETYRNWGEDTPKPVFDYSKLNFPHEQYDPQIVIDEAITIIKAKNPMYRNVLPKSIIEDQKSQLAGIWTRKTKNGEGETNELVSKAGSIAKETPVE
ncbi:SDR family oxidoreductase [Bifidobacterium sp.]|uniref:SDR family oxidoreductase n=1 Tax=Bifidobacterium sp. TaxID=41200 RepID=UPI0039EC7B83